jgi:hypothetical protein
VNIKKEFVDKISDIDGPVDRDALHQEWDSTPFDFLDHRLGELSDYWYRAIPDGASMPSRKLVNPSHFKNLLDDILLTELEDPLDIRAENCLFRVVGTNVTYLHGKEMTRKYLSELEMPNRIARALVAYQYVAEKKAPVRIITSKIKFDSEYVRAESLLLPLSENGEFVNMVLSTIIFNKIAQP